MCSEPRLVNVPIKPHLKKYLLRTIDTPEPFRLDGHTSLGQDFLSRMNRNKDLVNLNDRFSATLAVELSTRLERKNPAVRVLVHVVNSSLETKFQEALFLWIFAQGTAGINPHNSCKNFLFFYEIDESEYTYDAAYKAWQRYKSSKRDRLKKIARKRATQAA